jgi:hypothetical protein
MTCPYYILYEFKVAKGWSLIIWVNRKGEVETKLATDYVPGKGDWPNSKFMENVDFFIAERKIK